VKISDSAIQHRATVIVLILAIVLFGVYSYVTLPRESFPDITIPYLSVVTAYTSGSPSPVDVEQQTTNVLEKEFKSIEGIKKMTSTSVEGMSIVSLEFEPNVDVEEAKQDVKDKIDQAQADLPEEADEPTVMEINVSEFPIMIIHLSGDIGLQALKKIGEDLEEEIEKVTGVLNAEVVGGQEEVIRVEPDLLRLNAYKLNLLQMERMLQEEHVNVTGGSVKIGPARYLLRVPRQFKEPKDFQRLPLAVINGKPIYLSDLAEVKQGFRDATTHSRLDGKPSVAILVRKRSGENIIRINRHVKKILAEARAQLPEGVTIAITDDQSKNINMMVTDLENNIASGMILVVIVLLLAMGLRNSLFVAVAIPLSMLMAFTVLQLLGLTLNMIVLFSLILALGMLVDNAIVIVENIYRHRQEGLGRITAAKVGTAEVAWPVITSTITTLCAFSPLLFWPGIMGEFMSFLPKTVIVVLSASLIVAMVINPVLCSIFMKVKSKPVAQKAPVDGSGIPPAPHGRFIARYERFLRFALRYRGIVIASAFALLIGTFVIYGALNHGTVLFPEIDPARANIDITLPEGSQLKTSDGITREIEGMLDGYDNLEHAIANVGTQGGSRGFGQGGSAPNLSQITLKFIDYDERQRMGKSSAETVEDIRRKLDGVVGADVEVQQEKGGPPVGAPISVEIHGEDFDELGKTAEEAKRLMFGVPGVEDIRDDFLEGQPELRILPYRDRVLLLGLTSDRIGQVLKGLFFGRKVDVIRTGNDEIDIRIRLPEADRLNSDTIRNLWIPGPKGPVPLSTAAETKYSSGVGAIRRKDQRRTVTVSANVAKGFQQPKVLKDVQRKLDEKLRLEEGQSVEYTGENEEQQKAKEFLSRAFVVALVLIALVLITQFNSVVLPIIILISIMLSLIGVLAGLLLTWTPFVIIMTGVGVISLAGVVVNNAIVLVDYTEQLRKRGLSPTEAVVRAGCVRLRPVLLTAITTILGLLPMATGVSINFVEGRIDIGTESSQWWGSMAVAVIFGLAVATVLTLVVVPTLYSLLTGLRQKLAWALPQPDPADAEANALQSSPPSDIV